jgi:hypothetical protein
MTAEIEPEEEGWMFCQTREEWLEEVKHQKSEIQK